MDEYQNLSESITERASSWNLADWTSQCHQLTLPQLNALVPLATHLRDNHTWKDKLQQLFFHLPQNGPLESFGKALDTPQLIEIIQWVRNHPNESAYRQKLSSLLIGITPVTFKNFLSQATQEELSFLREEAMTEAIQHNLSLITTELSSRFSDFFRLITEIENNLSNIDFQSLGKAETQQLYQSIENLRYQGKNINDLTIKALTIAWNANRTDLIQELGKIKEHCHKYIHDSIGKPADNETASLGLFKILDKKVEQLFSDQDSNGNWIPMRDTTPALEALVKFSVWYIKDYYDVGLLTQAQLHNNREEETTEEILKTREQLFKEAESNLSKIGLKTLFDLKNARIYSKKALIEYIESVQTTEFSCASVSKDNKDRQDRASPAG